MAKSLFDEISAREDNSAKIKKEQAKEDIKPKKTALQKIINNTNVTKDKAISAKVNSEMYNMFTRINQAVGLSNNSCLNMLISEYIRENKYKIEENF